MTPTAAAAATSSGSYRYSILILHWQSHPIELPSQKRSATMAVSNGPTVSWKVRVFGTGEATQIEESFVDLSQRDHLMDESMFVDMIASGAVGTSYCKDTINVGKGNVTALTADFQGTLLGVLLQVVL